MGSFQLSALNSGFFLPIICVPRDEGQLPNLFSHRTAPRTELILKTRNPWGFPELRGSQCSGISCTSSPDNLLHGKCSSSFLEPFCFVAGWLNTVRKLPLHLCVFSGKCFVYKSPLKYRLCLCGVVVGCFYSIYLQAWTIEVKREISPEVNI